MSAMTTKDGTRIYYKDWSVRQPSLWDLNEPSLLNGVKQTQQDSDIQNPIGQIGYVENCLLDGSKPLLKTQTKQQYNFLKWVVWAVIFMLTIDTAGLFLGMVGWNPFDV